MRHLLFLFCLFSSTIAAQNGVLISAGSAAAGGVTSGDAPGWPITLGEPGLYRLVEDLDISGLPGAENITMFEVTASNVTLDLNGHHLSGPVGCSGLTNNLTCAPEGTGAGIRTNGAGLSNLEVRNGRITGMGDRGIDCFPDGGNFTTFCRALDLDLSSNARNNLYLSEGARVERCSIGHSGEASVRVHIHSLVRNNRIFRSGGLALLMAGPDSTADDNVSAGGTWDLASDTAFRNNVVSPPGNFILGDVISGGVDLGNNFCPGDCYE